MTSPDHPAAPNPTSSRRAGRPAGSRTALARTPRKVHLGHFAFMRAVVQGIPIAESWNRYLAVEGDHRDIRTVNATIRWVREEFVVAARKASKYSTARLLALEIKQIPQTKTDLPDLYEWAAENGWDGFGEAQILAAYQETFAGQLDGSASDAATGQAGQGGPTSKAEQRSRLIDRQLHALRWLETLIAQKPQAGDACGAWFGLATEKHLAKAGLLTLAQLIEHINGIGHRWYRSIEAIGPVKAQRLQAWCAEHEATTGKAVGRHVAVRRSRLYGEEQAIVAPAATALRPLEKFLVPAELDGSQGRFRQPNQRCLMSARNDYEAILAWLQSKHPLSPEAEAKKRARRRGRAGSTGAAEAPLAWLDVLSHTQRACRKEAERFLLWAILERGKPLSSMTTEDCIAYRDFLAAPPPDWCGPRGRERWSPLWRPFEGALSASARRQAVTHLKNLYRFLTDQNYLMGNPWVGVAMPRTTGQRIATSRSFTNDQWAFVGEQLKSYDNSEKSQRLIFALSLLYTTGLRLSEAVNAKVADLRWVEYPAGEGRNTPTVGWELTVVGKGEKLREVIVPEFVVDTLKLYLTSRGLDPNLGDPVTQQACLLGSLSAPDNRAKRLVPQPELFGPGHGRGIADQTLYALLKAFFMECSYELAMTDAAGAERFGKASTHWLRHTHASHAIARGVPLEVAQVSLGHASLATTTIYVTTEKERRMRTMQNAWGRLCG